MNTIGLTIGLAAAMTAGTLAYAEPDLYIAINSADEMPGDRYQDGCQFVSRISGPITSALSMRAGRRTLDRWQP